MTLATHLDPAIVTRGEIALGGLRGLAPSLAFATILTDDGFSVVSVEGSGRNNDRFASMASSTQALADAVSRELSLGESEFVVVAADRGHVVRVRVAGHPLVLAAFFTDRESIGTSLNAARRTARRIAVLLAAH